MTKETDQQKLKKKVMSQLERADRAAIIGRALQSENGRANIAAVKARDEYGLASLLEDSFNADGSARYTRATYDALSPEDQEARRVQGFKLRSARSLIDAVSDLGAHLETLVKKEGKLDTSLLSIAGAEPIMAAVGASERELLKGYQAYSTYSEAASKFKKGEDMAVDKEKLKEIVSEASAAEAYKRFSKTYPKLAPLAADLARLAPSEKLSKDQLADGAMKARDMVGKDLERKYGKNYEERATKAVLGALKTMLSSEDQQQEQTAASLYYQTQRGYGLGERRLADTKKK